MSNYLKWLPWKRKKVVANGYDFEMEGLKLPGRQYRIATRNPLFRTLIRDASIAEDEENSYYSGILNTMADHCIGTVPKLMGLYDSAEVNEGLETKWLEWAIANNIGTSIRHIRRAAARTGLGIGLPYVKVTPEDPIGLAIKTIPIERLTTPRGGGIKDRIIDGIQYDKNWDIEKIFVQSGDDSEPTEYHVSDILIWSKQINEDPMYKLPECGPAFCLYPQIRRYMEAIVRAEEFRACTPMAVELDPNLYRPEDVDTPSGKMKYEPGNIPTLPPGTKLAGVPIGTSASDKVQFIMMLIAAAARCVQMPKNIALGDSSGHNMATAAIDIQPWEDRVRIDRTDFRPVIDKVVRKWYERAVLVSGYLPIRARTALAYDIGYDKTFQHPDPKKNADARNVDLKSGANTLHRIYTEKALNADRELNREARMLGITRQELNKAILQARTGVKEMEPEREEADDDN